MMKMKIKINMIKNTKNLKKNKKKPRLHRKKLKKNLNLEMNQMTKEEDVISKLPIEIFLDILSRLPIKTISQCRWVSKTWYDLVLNPRFATIHYARALDNQSISAVFLGVGASYKPFYLIDHECFDNRNVSATAYNVKLPEFQQNFASNSNKTPICYQIVGCVNGLICFSPGLFLYDGLFSPPPYYITNPITSEYLLLPKSPNHYFYPIQSGFGFDPISNKYKVIRIFRESLKPENNSETGNVVEVYTFGSNSWRNITTNISYISSMGKSSVLVNGCLHWIAYPQPVIFSFNVATEGFKLIPLPSRGNEHCYKSESWGGLTVLGDCLCAIATFSCYTYEIWMLKEYGKEDSWAKEYVIEDLIGWNLWEGTQEILQLRSGELLLLNRGHNLAYYDPEKRSFEPIQVQNLEEKHIELPIFQVGSLFHPRMLVIS